MMESMNASTLPAFVAALLLAGSNVVIVNEPERFAPGIASTHYSEIRLTISPDGRTALWFSRNRPGGAGGYDIWVSRRSGHAWTAPEPVSFNSPARDFDPAFSADGRHVYFSSDRPGGEGGDDIYRVAVAGNGFGAPEHLGPNVNGAAKEWAPMLAPDGRTLLFSSDRAGGAGRQDLYVAKRDKSGFAPARPLPGELNTTADEFDATFLADGRTIVFARAADLRTDRVELFAAAPQSGNYPAGARLERVNGEKDSYGPMLDWSSRDTFTFSAKRPGSGGMDLYRVRYRL
jgi:TolB protein